MALQDALSRILNKRQAYRRALAAENADVRIVLADLRRFCGAQSPLAKVSPISRSVDPYATMVAVGRFEVWQRIQTFLNITDADLANLQDRTEGESHE